MNDNNDNVMSFTRSNNIEVPLYMLGMKKKNYITKNTQKITNQNNDDNENKNI